MHIYQLNVTTVQLIFHQKTNEQNVWTNFGDVTGLEIHKYK
jgi:hypothetical protein